ncbi:MAG: glycosyltransferase family 2 protein [Lachnospiraceae bacterium]|nr:glycosyltransferase family 2 protein [Lachnospiraceae bacterium]
MEKKIVSIIIPIYKTEKYLRRCIESVLEQTYKKIEVILVNDGSPDNSLNICEEYEKKDSRVHIVNKKNGGLSSARNAGILVATGDYITFLDSDDYLKLDAIESLFQVLEKTNADISYIHETIVNDE